MSKTKSYDISKKLVYQAYEYVKKKDGCAGIDNVSIEEFEKDLKGNLYKIWNRMSSGTYFAPSVKRVEIPKGDGKTRPLGIPTVADRIAQTVVKMTIEPDIDKIFSKWSYGYRPNKIGYEAVGRARENCWKYNFVLDIDIKGFFDNIDHEMMMKAVKKHVKEKWAILYIERWLKAKVAMPDGREIERDKGTPQGGVISPILANLFLHYVLDKWLENNFPMINYERFADDAILHCRTEKEAGELKEALEKRFKECNLELHPEKTKIAYCKDDNRKGEYPETSFTFLGFEFRPRRARNQKTEELFVSFLPAIGEKRKEKTRDEIRQMEISKRTGRSLEEIRNLLNPYIRGKMNYYGQYYKSEMYSIIKMVEEMIRKWYRRKYRKGVKKAKKWAKKMYFINNSLFAHWEYIKPFKPKARMIRAV